ncbi:MAG: adenine phosphoribosyltransferase [Candidatus Hydrogenedentes bacterium]|nr:adenine phosphoribosyltransferase [Candidatus Hydrogenedentota bacterium]
MLDLAPLIRNVPDFPKPGIQFKDITTLLLVPEAFQQVIDGWKERYSSQKLDAILGIDARGFIFGATLAYAMGLPFVPVRKVGKLPGTTIKEEYELEYGTATVEIHADALRAGQRVVVIDDLLATGGTMAAVHRLLQRLGVELVEAAFLVELPPLKGRERLREIPIHTLVEFMVD